MNRVFVYLTVALAVALTCLTWAVARLLDERDRRRWRRRP